MAVSCPLCNAPYASCGPHNDMAVPITTFAPERTPNTMAELKKYTYIANGIVVTAKLTAADAKRLGAKAVAATPTPALGAVKADTDVRNAGRVAVPNKGR